MSSHREAKLLGYLMKGQLSSHQTASGFGRSLAGNHQRTSHFWTLHLGNQLTISSTYNPDMFIKILSLEVPSPALNLCLFWETDS